MRRVYICSPFRAANEDERRRNIDYAKELTRRAVNDGCAPFTPHLYLPQVLDDTSREERQKGVSAGMAFLDICDEVLVGERYGISVGMKKEICRAKKRGIPVTFSEKTRNILPQKTNLKGL